MGNDKVGLTLQADEAYLLLTLLTRAVQGDYPHNDKKSLETILQRLGREWSKTDQAARLRLEAPFGALAHTY